MKYTNVTHYTDQSVLAAPPPRVKNRWIFLNQSFFGLKALTDSNYCTEIKVKMREFSTVVSSVSCMVFVPTVSIL